MDQARHHVYDQRVSVTNWLFGLIVVSFVAVLCLGAVVGGLLIRPRARAAGARWSDRIDHGRRLLLVDRGVNRSLRPPLPCSSSRSVVSPETSNPPSVRTAASPHGVLDTTFFPRTELLVPSRHRIGAKSQSPPTCISLHPVTRMSAASASFPVPDANHLRTRPVFDSLSWACLQASVPGHQGADQEGSMRTGRRNTLIIVATSIVLGLSIVLSLIGDLRVGQRRS